MARSLEAPPRRLGDIILALAVGALMLLGTAWVNPGVDLPVVPGWPLLLAAAFAVAFRRWRPVVVMWITILAGLSYTALGRPGGFYTIAIAVGIYTVAASRRRWAAVTGLVGGFFLFVLGDLAIDTGHGMLDGGALWFLGWLTVALLLGEVTRSRSDYIAAVEERAAERERSHQEQALRRAGEERMEIARDLHDVLAHSISIINVQAGAALHHLEGAPEQSRDALLAVRETGKRALSELRSSIDVLRRDPDGSVPTRPAPGLDDIGELAGAAELTGLRVETVSRGSAEVPAPVGLAAYRIVQESLTNVARHADATTATVTIDRRPDRLLVRVDDDGRGAPAEEVGGHGIDGMRERARDLDGRLTAGPCPGGGFRVEAHIPLGGDG